MAVDIQGMVIQEYLREMFKSPEEKEVQQLRLESLREGSFGKLKGRLDAYASTEDITTPKGIELAHGKITTALNAGKFGNEVAITDYVKNYLGALTQTSISQTGINTSRNNLFTLTNPSNIDKWLTEAQVTKDTTQAVANLENHIVDLSIVRNKLADNPTGSKVSTFLESRTNNAMAKIDKALVDLTGGKLTEKDIDRIMKGTYATMILADANMEAKIKELEITHEFKQPSLQEAQYLKILQDIESDVTDYDDRLNLEVQKHSFLEMSELVSPSGVGPTPELEKSKNDLALLAGFRKERLIGQYSGQYKTAYDSLKALRKKYPKKMVYVDFEEIMNKKVYNELYNYVSTKKNGDDSYNNKGVAPYSPVKTQESTLITNMLKNRTITFTKDIFDGSGKIWKQEGESIKGLGNPGPSSWKIQKDGIKRDSNNNLMSLNFDIPTGGMDWYPFPIRQGIYAKTSITLKPEDFVIEDSPYLSGTGYQYKKNGLFSYNIYNNLYELIQK